MPSAAMTGALGPYPMSREASGTAWQPDASRHGGVHAHGRRLDADGPCHAQPRLRLAGGAARRRDGLRLRHGHGHGAARSRRRHAAVPRDAEPRSADGPARLSAPPRRGRDRGRRRPAGRPPASARFLHGAVGQLQPPHRRPMPACSSMPACPASPPSARPPSCTACRSWIRPRRRSPITGSIRPTSPSAWSPPGWSSATSSSRRRASTAASRTSSAGHRDRAARFDRAAPLLEPDARTSRCRRAGRIWSAPSSSSRTRTRPAGRRARSTRGRFGERTGGRRRSPGAAARAARAVRRLRPRKRGRASACGRCSAAPNMTENNELIPAGGHHGPTFDVGKVSLGAIRDFRVAPNVRLGLGALYALNFVPARARSALCRRPGRRDGLRPPEDRLRSMT